MDYSIPKVHEGNPSNGGDMLDVERTLQLLTKADVDLAFSSEKLVNLHGLLMHLLAWDNNLEVMAEFSYISATSVERALEFDLLSGILDSELRVVENFTDDIQAEIVDTRHKLSSCRHSPNISAIIEKKLRGSEESLKKTQERFIEAKMQTVKLQRFFSAFKLENWKDDLSEASANGQLPNIKLNSRRRMVEQQKHILRMLEKCLARELDLEKNLSELRRNEEQLKLKLHYTGEVASRMEEAAEVVWGRFLEAENSSEVLMGISKEMVGRLQVGKFNLNNSFQRESELKSQLQSCLRQLDDKDAALKKLESDIAEHKSKSSQVPALIGKVSSLEEQLKKSELRLKHANDYIEESQEQITEMVNIVDKMKETIYDAESRAETAEAKVTQLTDTNSELTEEVSFLKSSAENNTKKMTLLEKQVRDLEIQVQHSKVSSEASQEQQNMLYAAIWDMETLIEDLKSKVAKAENKTETVEEQCIILSESNMELDKEVSFLRSRVKSLEVSLDQANKAKAKTAEEINFKTASIMDTVMKLARERERLQNQIFFLTKENEILVGKFRNGNGDVTTSGFTYENGHGKNMSSSENGLSDENGSIDSGEAISLSKSPQEPGG